MPSSTSMAWLLSSQGELAQTKFCTLHCTFPYKHVIVIYLPSICLSFIANVLHSFSSMSTLAISQCFVCIWCRASKSLSDDVSSSSHEKQLTVVWCDQASERVERLLKSITSTSSLKTDASMSAIAKEVISNRATVPVHPLRVWTI